MRIDLKSWFVNLEPIRNKDQMHYLANSVFEVIEDYLDRQPGIITRLSVQGQREARQALNMAMYILSVYGFDRQEMSRLARVHVASVSRYITNHLEAMKTDEQYKKQFNDIIQLLPTIEIY